MAGERNSGSTLMFPFPGKSGRSLFLTPPTCPTSWLGELPQRIELTTAVCVISEVPGSSKVNTPPPSLAVLSATVQWKSIVPWLLYTAPPCPVDSLALRTQLTNLGAPPLQTAPPCAAELSRKDTLTISGRSKAYKSPIAPPLAAVFPTNLQLTTMGLASMICPGAGTGTNTP